MLCDAVQGFGRMAIPKAPTWSRSRAQDPRPQGRRRPVDARRAPSPRRLLHGGGQEQGCARERCRRAVRRLRRGGALAVERRDADSEHVEKLWDARWQRFGPGWIDQRQHRPALSRQSQPPPRRARWRAADFRPAQHRLFARGGLRQRLGPAEPCAARARPQRPRGALVDPARLRPLHRRGGAGLGLPPHRRAPRARSRSCRVTRVRFLKADGTLDREVEAPAGHQFARPGAGQWPAARGRCEGSMACSTCHVIVAKEDFERCRRRARRKTTCSTSPPTSRAPRGSPARSTRDLDRRTRRGLSSDRYRRTVLRGIARRRHCAQRRSSPYARGSRADGAVANLCRQPGQIRKEAATTISCRVVGFHLGEPAMKGECIASAVANLVRSGQPQRFRAGSSDDELAMTKLGPKPPP
jgi:ferredoxin